MSLTPESRFENLPNYPFKPNYLNVPDGDGGELRVHYVEEGPLKADPVLLMHGEPSWSYLYRKMIPIIVDAGFRVIAPDLAGFGHLGRPGRQKRLHLSAARCRTGCRHYWINWIYAELTLSVGVGAD